MCLALINSTQKRENSQTTGISTWQDTRKFPSQTIPSVEVEWFQPADVLQPNRLLYLPKIKLTLILNVEHKTLSERRASFPLFIEVPYGGKKQFYLSPPYYTYRIWPPKIEMPRPYPAPSSYAIVEREVVLKP